MENALTDSLCATAGAGAADGAPEAVAWYARALGHDMVQRAYVPGPQKAVGRIQKCGAAGHAYFRAI